VKYIPFHLGLGWAEFWHQYESVNERVIALACASARPSLPSLLAAEQQESAWALQTGQFRLMTEL
jgi:hypothetical protein